MSKNPRWLLPVTLQQSGHGAALIDCPAGACLVPFRGTWHCSFRGFYATCTFCAQLLLYHAALSTSCPLECTIQPIFRPTYSHTLITPCALAHFLPHPPPFTITTRRPHLPLTPLHPSTTHPSPSTLPPIRLPTRPPCTRQYRSPPPHPSPATKTHTIHPPALTQYTMPFAYRLTKAHRLSQRPKKYTRTKM